MSASDFYWLPRMESWADALAKASVLPVRERLPELARLAGYRLDFLQAMKLDRLACRAMAEWPDGLLRVRLAILSSATTEHLLPGIRLGGLRRGLWVDTYVGPMRQHHAQAMADESELYAFRPDAVLFHHDAMSAVAELELGAEPARVDAAISRVIDDWRQLWNAVRQRCGASPIQQTVLNVAPTLFGNFDALTAAAPGEVISRLNHAARVAASEAGALVLDMDRWAMRFGLDAFWDPVRWYHAKQEIAPQQGYLFGDLAARQLAALRGLARKCLVLDLDNTVWGGVVGDDGVEGLVLGQGSAAGEAYSAFQHYVRRLAERGIVLAVCSKNTSAIAEDAFDTHPEMVLKKSEFAAFKANWEDKAANLRAIASELSLGLDQLVFVDDNPAERLLVRAELPMVAVPELPTDPARYAACLADGGWFEATSFTADDRSRSAQYGANKIRREAMEKASDLPSYLNSLDMVLTAGYVDSVTLPRVAQLVNKTNQFNLTTRRYTDAQIAELLANPGAAGFQFRLSDRFGDNGIISVVFALPSGIGQWHLDTWLMSCRVLGRNVEKAVLAVVAETARRRGIHRLIGEYRPTPKSILVKDHYAKLGFAPHADHEGSSLWSIAVDAVDAMAVPEIKIIENIP